MLKAKAFIFIVLSAIILLSDLMITPYEITYAQRPILAFFGIMFVSYLDIKMSEAREPKRLRRVFYYSIIVLFILGLTSNLFFQKPMPAFPFVVGCLLQTLIYLKALKRAEKIASGKDIKIFEAPIPDIGYKVMSALLFIRDLLLNHGKLLESAGIKEGDHVLDYGCGPGAFTFAASKIVGDRGVVFALDNQHLSIEGINIKAETRGVTNIKTIYTNQGETGLDGRSVDYVLMIGVLHLIRNPENVLSEMARVMKDDGRIGVVGIHIGKAELQNLLSPLFTLERTVNQMDILVKKPGGG